MELKYLTLPCPKFKRGRQTANVTAGVWSRTPRRLRSHVFKHKRGSKTHYYINTNPLTDRCAVQY